MKTIKTLLMLLVLLLFVVHNHAQNVGDQAPDFTFTSTDNEEVSLSDYHGNVVFLFLFGDKCSFCQAVGPTTETELYQKYKKQYDDFVALGLDLWDGSLTSVKNFKATTGITYQVLVNASSMGSLYRTTYDRVIIIDRAGVIRYKGSTRVSNEVSDIDGKLAEILADTDIVMDIENADGETFFLGDIYPNPVYSQSNLLLNLPQRTFTTLNVFNSLGQVVLTPLSGFVEKGEHKVTIDASNLKRGIYYYRLDVDGFSQTKKFVVE